MLVPGEGRAVDPRPSAKDARILFEDGHETVRLEEWTNGKTVTVDNPAGLEFFLLSGYLTIGTETLEPLSWGRLPAGTALHASVGPQDAKIWIKQGPLLHADICRLPEQSPSGQAQAAPSKPPEA